MNKIKLISHDDFVKGYRTGEYSIFINKSKAGDFVMSKVADKHNKPTHVFWTWIGIILTFPLPIILLFFSWIYSIISFVFGLMIVSSSRKSAEQFVMQNMIDDKNFWEYMLMYKGAKMVNENGEEITFAL